MLAGLLAPTEGAVEVAFLIHQDVHEADAVRFVCELNITGTILPSQVFGRYMAQQGEGVILNISSMNALRPLTKIPAYSAAKAAISGLSDSWKG